MLLESRRGAYRGETLGNEIMRAYPVFTSTTSPASPRLAISFLSMIFITLQLLFKEVSYIGKKCERTGALYSLGHLALELQ